jgi:hypothetical protein
MRILAVFILIAAFAHAQPGCPPVSFQNAVSANTNPSASTHLTFVRQSDGSYTAYEMADASPFGIIRTTPNFGSELTACLPKHSPLPPLPAPQGSGVSPGAPSQTQVFARLASGDFVEVQSTGDELYGTEAIDIAVFRPNMTLVSETKYAVSAVSPHQFALADVNGDGNLDLIALASVSSGGLQAAFDVFLGNGDGTFQPPIEHLVPGTDQYVRVSTFAVADVNGDGKPDLVFGITTPAESGIISLLAGNGDGTFGNESFVSSANVPDSITLADLNGDGKLDLIFSDEGFLSVALGTGDGSFGSPVKYPYAGGPALVGDIDGDGFPDIVCGGTILFGDGTGAFPQREDYLSDAGGTVLTDLDLDGRLDIVTGVTGNPLIFTGGMSVLFGDGSRSYWGAPISIVPMLSAGDVFFYPAVATADFNADGIPDLALSDDAGGITILQGSSAGLFDSVFEYQLPSDLLGLPIAMITGDFNGDGKPDLAVAVQDYAPNSLNHALVFLGNGDGTLQDPIAAAVPAGLNVASLAAGDFNGDGKLDLAVVVNTLDGGAADEVLVFLGNGDGSFQAPKTYAVGVGASAIVVGDFNGDGRLDLVTANSGTDPLENGSLSVLLGNGDGTFSAATSIPLSGAVAPSPYTVAAADLNGDGKLDLIVTLLDDTALTNSLAILLGRGDGSFLAPAVYPVTSLGVTVGDLNGDRIPDVIVFASESGLDEGGAGYLLGNGDGTFAPEVYLAASLLVTAHFSRDGKLDLAGTYLSVGAVSFLNTSPPLPPIRGRYRWLGDR